MMCLDKDRDYNGEVLLGNVLDFKNFSKGSIKILGKGLGHNQ